ncbi:MAG TPA: biotin--[acetyl-CoA-carboxylase] ligase [Limnobacter sp.]|nr:biotin--[acetyl-CoA-carboxylase] ligase [Limnobacter sp.]
MVTQAEVHWIELDVVESTNSHLINAYQSSAVRGVVAVVAHAQTAGRGRAGRVWHASPGASLCFSLGLPLSGPVPALLPLCTGLALAHTLQNLGISISLKWPNDLLLAGGKLGGVLCEAFQVQGQAHVVIGVGLNLDNPSGVRLSLNALPVACLHAQAAVVRRSPVAWAKLLVPALLEGLAPCLAGQTEGVPVEFAQWDAWRGLPLQVEDAGRVLMHGTGMGINAQGAYLLDTAEGLKAVHAGDLSLRVQHV